MLFINTTEVGVVACCERELCMCCSNWKRVQYDIYTAAAATTTNNNSCCIAFFHNNPTAPVPELFVCLLGV